MSPGVPSLVAGAFAWARVACAPLLAGLTAPGLLPVPVDPVAAFRQDHVVVLTAENSQSPQVALLSDPVRQDLRQSYQRIFGDKPARPGRFFVGGLQRWRPKAGEPWVADGLRAETRQVLDAWAQEVLRVASEATGEKLVVSGISVGQAVLVGDGAGSAVHRDGSFTYLHATASLEGSGTLAFPGVGNELNDTAAHRFDRLTGTASLQRFDGPTAVGDPFTVQNARAAGLGETLLFGGIGYVRGGEGRRALVHASPPDAGPNRLTLFLSLNRATP